MADFTDADFNRENLEAGLARLGQMSAPRGMWMPDIPQDDTNYQLEQKVAFLTGYVSNLLDRVERLEK